MVPLTLVRRRAYRFKNFWLSGLICAFLTQFIIGDKKKVINTPLGLEGLYSVPRPLHWDLFTHQFIKQNSKRVTIKDNK